MPDILSGLLSGFQVAFDPLNLLFCFAGVFIGTLIGVLPGIGPIGAMSILLPMTFGLSPVSSLIMLAGIYYGAQYGGSTTSILVNIPGDRVVFKTRVKNLLPNLEDWKKSIENLQKIIKDPEFLATLQKTFLIPAFVDGKTVNEKLLPEKLGGLNRLSQESTCPNRKSRKWKIDHFSESSQDFPGWLGGYFGSFSWVSTSSCA